MLDKKARTVLAYVFVIISIMLGFILIANAVVAYSSGNSALSISYNLVTEGMAGRSYTSTCFAECDLVFSLAYSGSNPPSSVAIDTSKLQAEFNWVNGQDKFQDSKIYYLNEYQERVTDYSIICLPYDITEANGTITHYKNCTQVMTGSHLETRQEWKELSTLTLEKDKTYYIDIRGYFKPGMEGFKVDVIPSVNIAGSNFKLQEMAWWTGASTDEKWKTYINQTTTSTIKNFTALINYSSGLWNDKEVWVNIGDLLPGSTNSSIYTYRNSTNERYYMVNASENAQLPAEVIGNWTQSYLVSNAWASYLYVGHNCTNDSSPTANHGTVTGATEVNGYIGKALNFSGGDYVALADNAGLSAISPLSISVWVSTTNADNGVIVSKDDAGTEWEWYAYITADDKLIFYVFDKTNNGGIGRSDSTTIANDGNWHHLVFVWNGSTTNAAIKIYIDSAQVDDGNEGWGTFAAMRDTTASVRMGSIAGTSNFFTGLVDEARIAKSEWSASQIGAEYGVIKSNLTFMGKRETEELPNATEAQGDSAIQAGITSSVINATATNYTSQQVYIRNVTGGQQLGRFDVVASSGNQRWAFNYVTTGDPTSGFTYMLNITPVLYVWEAANLTTSQISSQVQAFIDSTKQ
jgi:hypothetical protein